MRPFVKRVLRAFFPRRCLYCDRVTDPDTYCCPYCEPDVPHMEEPLCYRCGRTRKLCVCRDHRRQFDRCVAAMRYEDGVARAVLSLKKEQDAEAVEAMATEMVTALRRFTNAASLDFVSCVPMHRKERRERSYNQSELLAKEIAVMLDLPFVQTLTKLYDTRPQKSLHHFERGGNLLGVFDLIADVKEKKILLIDDVITTGATLHECAKMMKIGGAASVTALVFAATVPKDKEDDRS